MRPMIAPKEILKKYWGFSQFRSQQEEIISSVLKQNDVITLLPTGGGKSICFQIPALAKEGICLVISPLIALMKDQIENLERKGIKAISIPSGTKQNDLITLFDNIKFGGYKFLYISPERLQSYFIRQKIKELNINLIAIDEAHCISEWGHDFRPSYRGIKEIRSIKPTVNFIALTATANKKIIEDISKNLDLRVPEIFKQIMAVIIIGSVIMMVWWENKNEKAVPNSKWFGGLMGFCAGVTTMLGNLAGAFSNIFFLAMRLPKDQFIGTAAWLFFIINIFKLPFHIYHWESISMESMAVNFRLFPMVIVGFLVGLKVVKKIKNELYRKLILVLTAIGAILIFFK